MRTLKKILFPTDFSRCANQALAHALYLARQYQAELHILHVAVSRESVPPLLELYAWDAEASHSSLHEKTIRRTTDMLKPLQTNDVKIKMAYRYGIATAPKILLYAKENEVNLIVMGTHGRRGLGYLFLGSVAEEVVRMAPCSVLTIRERKEPMPAEAVKQILVPVDFSEFSKRALASAKKMAAAYHARLQLLHVVEEVIHPALYRAIGASIFAFKPDLMAAVQHELRNMFAETEGPEAEVDFHVTEGHPANTIVNFAASHTSDLIVISTHGLASLRHTLRGSVTEKVVRTAQCPVLTVSAFGKSLL